MSQGADSKLCNKPEGHVYYYVPDKEAFGMWGCPVWQCTNCGRLEDSDGNGVGPWAVQKPDGT